MSHPPPRSTPRPAPRRAPRRRGLPLRLDLHLGGRVLGACVLGLVLALALAASAGLVEAARYGPGAALRLALSEAPVVVLPLAPVLAAAAAGLAAARLVARGEAEALATMGLSPLRVARGAAVVGLVFGLGAQLGQDRAAPPLARSALSLRAALDAPVAGAARADWLWVPAETGGGFRRLHDGTAVAVGSGVVGTVDPAAGALSAEQRRQAHALALPAVAGGPELAEATARPLVVERWQRRVRPLACSLLALLAFLGPRAGSRRRLAPALVLGLSWQAIALAAAGLAASGRVGPLAAAVAPVLLLGLLLALRCRPPGARRR